MLSRASQSPPMSSLSLFTILQPCLLFSPQMAPPGVQIPWGGSHGTVSRDVPAAGLLGILATGHCEKLSFSLRSSGFGRLTFALQENNERSFAFRPLESCHWNRCHFLSFQNGATSSSMIFWTSASEVCTSVHLVPDTHVPCRCGPTSCIDFQHSSALVVIGNANHVSSQFESNVTRGAVIRCCARWPSLLITHLASSSSHACNSSFYSSPSPASFPRCGSDNPGHASHAHLSLQDRKVYRSSAMHISFQQPDKNWSFPNGLSS